MAVDPARDEAADAADRALVRRIVEAGSRSARDAAFHELVERYQHRVHAICWRYFNDREDAAEATQETFVTLVRRLGQYRGEARFSTWLYRVTTNTCHDLARRRARRPQTPVADVAELVGDPRDEGADVEAAVEAGDLAARVQRALLTLDPVTRELVILCAIEGQPYADVAALVDMPVGTVKSRVSRARVRLADLLADERPTTATPTSDDRPDERPTPRPRSRGPP